MGTSLVGLLPQNTYVGLIKVGNNTALNATLKTLSDGAGNDLPMQASTTAINFTGTTTGLASGVSGAIQFSNGSAFASDAANLFWDDTNNRLGVGTNAPSALGHFVKNSNADNVVLISNTDTTSGTARSTIQTQVGSMIGSMTAIAGFGVYVGSSTNDKLLLTTQGNPWANIQTGGNFNIGVLANDLGAKLGIKGSGSTSATTSLLVQNSGGTNIFKILDDGTPSFGGVGLNGKLNFNRSSDGGGIAQVGTNGGLMTFTEFSGAGFRFEDGYGKYPLFMANGKSAFNKGSAPVASAQVEIVSTTGGFLPPVMTTTQKNAIASPAAGLVLYDSTAKSPGYYDGTNWGYTGGALQNATGNGGTLNVSFAAGNIVNLTLNATTTLAFANSVIGTYIIQVTQSAGGGSSLVYPASVKWSGGTAPTLSTAVGKTDILTFYYDGTNYYGNYSLNY
jgi:hypothetical protein